ncbi:MAG: TlpA disulfide reductase family protein, partial [Bacteroidia bacterium]
EGAMAPDIKLKTPAGDSLALSSLRGKVVLIDFWASWCGPCRRENPNVKKIYEKYKDQGFEIYGVSLDNNASRWNDAIAKDGLTWKHVSDLAGWQSSAAKLYGVRSIPATFLLDKEGRIYKSGFRSHELEGLLQQLLTE